MFRWAVQTVFICWGFVIWIQEQQSLSETNYKTDFSMEGFTGKRPDEHCWQCVLWIIQINRDTASGEKMWK